jgi:ligand-binding sensor domain-containing protein/two-component sensor histidine kinase
VKVKRVTLVLAVSLICCALAPAQPTVLHFDHISIEDGLSESTVGRILQDRHGYMWFGTQDGLNQYDGHLLTIFRNDPTDSNSLSDSYVTALCEDYAGDFWIGTNSGGIEKFERSTRTFSHFGPVSRELLHGEYAVHCIVADSAGHLWAGTFGGGILCRDPHTLRWKSYCHSNLPGSLSNNNVWAMYIDRSGVLWIGTFDGLDRYNAREDRFETFRVPSVRRGVPGNNFNAITEDASGTLWIASWGYGIVRFDPRRQELRRWLPPVSEDGGVLPNKIWTLTFDLSGCLWIGTRSSGLWRYNGASLKQFTHEPDNAVSLSTDEVMSLHADRSGILWIGTNGGGVNKYSTGYRGFLHYRHSEGNANSIRGNNVWGLHEDHLGNIWVGMLGTGLDRIDLAAGRVIRGGLNAPAPKSPSSLVVAILEDRQGMLWIGTQGDGLMRYDPKRNRLYRYVYSPSDSASLGGNVVTDLLEDRDGRLWIATFGGGISRYERHTNVFTRFTNVPGNPRSLSDNFVMTMTQSAQGGLWVGTFGGGLVRFVNGDCSVYRNDPHDANSLSNSRILSLLESQQGLLWIGTWGGGLNCFDAAKGSFTRYTKRDGLPNSTIDAILEDDHGDLWMSTNKGITRFTPASGIFKSFDQTDGLQSNEFNQGAAIKTRRGELFFGGINGITRFHPDSVLSNPTSPPVVLTSFSVVGQPFRIDGDLSRLPEIRVKYSQSTFTFEFAALDYMSPSRNKYAYLMDGFDRTWVRPVAGQFATYSNVAPGKYLFRVAASNNDGVWNWDGAVIRVVVVPPPWRTWWAYIGYAMVFLGSIAAYVKAKTRRQANVMEQQKVRLLEGEIQLAKERMISESLRRAEEKVISSLREKEALLKEIHHRVKNNMQVISSLLNLQADQIDDQGVRDLFQQSQDRVRSMALIHEKLYRSDRFSKIDFNTYARELATQLTRTYANSPVSLDIVVEDIQLSIENAIPCGLIINELVTNSLKHAFPVDGTMTRTPTIVLKMCTREDGTNVLSVSDNGVGLLPPVDFYHPSTLGLELVNSLTEQIGGTIAFDNNGGTTVTITFPSEP